MVAIKSSEQNNRVEWKLLKLNSKYKKKKLGESMIAWSFSAEKVIEKVIEKIWECLFWKEYLVRHEQLKILKFCFINGKK